MTIQVISIYAPNLLPTAGSQEEYVNFIISLEHFLEEARNVADAVIVGGDWNMVLDDNLDAEKGTNTPKICIDQLLELMDNFTLTDVFRSMYPERKSHTFAPAGQNPKGIFRRLDYFLVSADLLEMIDSIEHVEHHISDHRRVVLTLTATQKKKKAPSLWRHNDILNKKAEFIEECEAEVKDVTQREELTDARAKWEYIKYRIRKISRRYNKRRIEERSQR